MAFPLHASEISDKSETGRDKHVSGSVLTGFLPSFPSQFWVSDVTFVTCLGDQKCDASHLSHFWEECDALAHENILFNLWRFLSHPSRKTSHFGTVGTKPFWTGRNLTIRLGLKNAFLFPSQISHISRKREAGRPFGIGPTLSPSRIVTFFPVQKGFVPARPKCDVFWEGCDKKRDKFKKYFRVRERHILPRNVTRHIFCHRKKWRHSPKSEMGSLEEIRVRPTLMAIDEFFNLKVFIKE